ncbi:MAG: 16S rRNA processing protein RimM [Succinivibrio sp.]|nr:16S rRNA processing protein RimM [Succinivibrio sp.]
MTDAISPEDMPRPMGRVGSAYGLSGYAKIASYTQIPESLFEYSPWYVKDAREGDQDWREVKLEDYRPYGKGFIAKFCGYDSPESVRALAGKEIGIRRSSLPQAAEGELYLADLVGCEVIGLGGVMLGKVLRIWDHGASPVMEVSPSDHPATGRAENRLIPYVAGPIVKAVDLEAKTIRVEWGEDY